VELAARRSRAYAPKVGDASQSAVLSEMGMKSHAKWMISSLEGLSCEVDIPARGRPRPLERRECTQENLCKGAVNVIHGCRITRASLRGVTTF